jgi:hypothetical protein
MGESRSVATQNPGLMSQVSTERSSRSGLLCAEAGTRAAAPFPAPLSPLAASFLRCASDRFHLTKPNTFLHNRVAGVATVRWCSGSTRNAVRIHPGFSIRLHRNPHRVSICQSALRPVSSGSMQRRRRDCWWCAPSFVIWMLINI